MEVPSLRTSIGEVRLHEVQLPLGERTWSFLHTGALLSFSDEQRFLNEQDPRPPYGVMLWPAAIALAHDVAARGAALAGKRVLELGAGTGLPGIVAASFGARVLQTDRDELALHVCAKNADRNRVRGVEHRLVDWATSSFEERYDLVIGSDILYATAMHDHLRDIFEAHLAPFGSVLLADPFRPGSMRLLERMEAGGWRVACSKWSIQLDDGPRAVAVYELTRHLEDDAALAG